MKLALLSCGNDIGFEIFEFVDPGYNGPKDAVPWTLHIDARWRIPYLWHCNQCIGHDG